MEALITIPQRIKSQRATQTAPRNKTAIIYTRVSTDEQATGYSLRAQKEELLRFCEHRGIEIVGHFEDDASAKTFNRPAFQKLLKHLKRNKGTATYLLVNKWDRFSRNITESLNMIQTLNGLQVEANATSQWIDFSIPENLTMLSIYLSSPEVENLRRGLNTKAGIRKSRKEGRWCNQAPLGYKNSRDDKNKPLIKPNGQAELISELFYEFANTSICKNHLRLKYNKLGLKLSKSHIDRVLRNPVYIGKLWVDAWKDEPEQIVNGVHEGIVPEHIFYKVQLKLNGKKPHNGPTKKSNPHLPLRGAIHCLCCGKPLSGSGSRGKDGTVHYYYHCKCKQRINAKKVHGHIEGILEQITPKKGAFNVYDQIIDKKLNRSQQESTDGIEELQSKQVELKQKIEKLEEKYILDDLDSDTYTKWKARYLEELDDITESLDNLRAQTNIGGRVNKALTFLSKITTYYHKGTPEIKRAILGSIFKESFKFSKTESRTPILGQTASLIMMVNRQLRNEKALKKGTSVGNSLVVLKEGIEPSLCCQNWILNPARLPVPPLQLNGAQM